MSESSIERRAMAWARMQGAMCLKIQAAKGWPDRCVIKPGGKMLFIEFKANGRKPNQLQLHVLDQLRKQGCNVEWTSSLYEFKEIYGAL